MNILVVLVLCFAAVSAYKPVGLEVFQNVHARVVGGEPATADRSPWQVGLFSSSGSLFCGGSLAGKRAVITAAHCCQGQSASAITVRYDGLDRTALKVTKRVQKIVVHPQYSSSTIDKDYCVIILQDDVVESATVKIVTIATTLPADGTMSDLTGWGRTCGSCALPTALQYVELVIIGQADCQKGWSGVNTITPAMICAGKQTASGCNGDSGGPLTVNKELVGIVSWGANGCPANTLTRPTVYANAVTGADWLKQTIQENNAN